MANLKKRFGRLLAAHRKTAGLTQEGLAEAADVSIDTIAKIETGATGVSFEMIERLAATLQIEAGALFVELGRAKAGALISTKLSILSEAELNWLSGIIDSALIARTDASSKKATKLSRRKVQTSNKSKI
ncbi:MAG: transcriptional regulator [Pseudomonadota bacterium]